MSTALASASSPENTSAPTIGGRITEARSAINLTTAQLARRMGVQTRTMANWERDVSIPRANRLVMLSGVLNVSSFWLLQGGEAISTEGNAGNSELAALQSQLETAKQLLASLTSVVDDLSQRVTLMSQDEDA